jgi:hypothetical protein
VITWNSNTNLTRLQIVYSERDTTARRSITGSIYPEKTCFDGMTYRIAKINVAAQLIYLVNSQLCNKKSAKLDFSGLSDPVAPTGLKSNHFFEDLKGLANISA